MNPFSLFRHFTLLSTMLLLGFYSGCCDQTILFTISLAALLFISTPLKHTNCHHWLCRLHIANRHLPPRDFPSLALQEICMRKAAWKCFLQKKKQCWGLNTKLSNCLWMHKGAEFPQISDFRTNSCMMVTWNCMKMGLCWKQVTVRALAVSCGHAYIPHNFAALG